MSRMEKVAQAVKKEISNIIHDEIKDPRLGFITVTRVEVSKDLRVAKIHYSVLGDAEAKENTSAALESAKGFVRRLIGQRVELKFTPEIIFREDKSIDYSFQLEEEFNKIKDAYESEEDNSTDTQE